MKKFKFLFVAVTMAFLFFSCSSKKKEKDAMDLTPMHRWDVHSQAMIDTLHRIPDSLKLAFIQKNAPNVIPNVLNIIERRLEHSIHVDSIVFSYGTGHAKGVQDSSGARWDVAYKDQLVARVWTKPATKLGNPIIVFVRCLNGVIELEGDQRIGTGALGFTIQKGEGLANHQPVLLAWACTARNLNIPIKKKNKIVSFDTYVNYLGSYKSVLFEGDFIDLHEGKVFHDGKEVDFQQRLTDTKKANALSKKKAKRHKH